MVRGIYQSGEPRSEQSGIVAAAVALLVVTLCVAGLFKLVNDLGGRVCMMAYYDQDVRTYKEIAEKALSHAGYGYTKLKDKGDYPPHQKYDPNPKVRKFLARDLSVPGDGTFEKAFVYVEFNSRDQMYGVTTVRGYEAAQ